MKKCYLLIGLLISYTVLFAQNSFPENGNVGVGGSGSYFNVLKITSMDSGPAYFYIDTNIPANDSPAPQIFINGYMYGDFNNEPNKAMKATLGWYYYQGNFYWTQYQSDLGYHKPSRIRLGKYTKNGLEYIRIEISNNSIYWSHYTISAMDNSDNVSSYYGGWTYALGEMPQSTTMQITTVGTPANVLIDGKVGIGTTAPTERLSVNGKIRAHEIKVEMANWPDYVFAKEYQLPTLQQMEKHIKEKGHLSGIPSAAEVKTTGVDLGEMNAKLLQKIEELTLHLIEQNKKFEAKISEQQLEINALKSKIHL